MDKDDGPLPLGIVGAGLMGELHARAVAENPRATLRAVADPDPERARRVAARYRATPYPGHEAMLAAEALAAVVVASPEAAHRAPTEAAAAAGCAVLVEKPMAASLADADAMIAACAAAGVPLMVGHLLRFESAYAALHDAVAAGAIGRLLTAYARRNVPLDQAERIAGRATLATVVAIHDLDQLLWLHPAAVVAVSAKGVHGEIHRRFGVADIAWTTVEFADGALGLVESGWSLPRRWGAFGDIRLDLVGSDGVLQLDLARMNLTGVDARAGGWVAPDTRHWPEVNGRLAGALRAEVDHFLAAAAAATPPLVDGPTGRRALELALAADRALATGDRIPLPLG